MKQFQREFEGSPRLVGQIKSQVGNQIWRKLERWLKTVLRDEDGV